MKDYLGKRLFNLKQHSSSLGKLQFKSKDFLEIFAELVLLDNKLLESAIDFFFLSTVTYESVFKVHFLNH